MIAQILNSTVKFLSQKLFDIRVITESVIPSGNYIISPNHLSWIDPILIRLYWPRNTSMMFLGPRKVVTNTFWKGWFVKIYPQIILTDERTGWPGKAAYLAVLDGLRNGKSLVIFPEGDAYPEEGDLKPLFNGAARFSMKTGVPIIPVGLCGTAELYYRKQLFINIGRPLAVSLSTYPDKGQIKSKLAQLRQEILGLISEYRDPVVTKKPLKWLTHLL